MMTLHEAIVQLLRQKGRQMTTTEIANELNKNKWYQKKNSSSKITPYQIHGRTKKDGNYAHLFDRNVTTVSLKGQSTTKVSTPPKKSKKIQPKPNQVLKNTLSVEKVLMNEKNFKIVGTIDNIVPKEPGLYCICIKDIKKLPKPFDSLLQDRNHNIIYIGVASQCLSTRFLNQELRAKGHGTFFRSIGAVLGHKPVKGSLKDKTNKRNYKFSKKDETTIINWLNSHLIVNWVEFNGDFKFFEETLIQKYLPLLNLAKNPMALKELSDLRRDCVTIANS